MQLEQHRVGRHVMILVKIGFFKQVVARATGCQSLQWALKELATPPRTTPLVEPWQVKLDQMDRRCQAATRRMAEERNQ